MTHTTASWGFRCVE